MSKRTIPIDGRELVIIDKSTKKYRFIVVQGKKVNIVDRIVEAGIDFCKASKYAKHFPRIEVLIKDYQFNSHISADPIKPLIYISLAHYHKKIDRDLATVYGSVNLYASFDHEVAHLYHELASRYLSMKRTFCNNTYVTVVNAMPLYKAPARRWYGVLRMELQLFFSNVLSEGIADYVKEFGDGDIIFDESTFEQLHQMAIQYAINAKVEWKVIVDEKDSSIAQKKVLKFREKIKNYPYAIGLHMVYTILYFNKEMTLEDLFKMNKFHRFVRLYAETMLVHGKKPIVVSTTGKFNAIIDYNQMVAELMAAYKRNTTSGSWWKRLWK